MSPAIWGSITAVSWGSPDFDRAIFGELRAADPAAGAKPVVRRHAAAIVNVEVDDPGAFRDFDTPEEYEAART